MTDLLASILRAVHVGLLRGASFLAPDELRAEWMQDWQSELWYVQRECRSMGSRRLGGEVKVAAFCLGAYQDALYLRRKEWRERPLLNQMRGSASACLFSLAAILAGSYGAGFLLPGVRAERHLSGYRLYSVPLARSAMLDEKMPGYKAGYVDGVAIYRISRERIWAAQNARNEWMVAHATPNLFTLLDLPVRFLPPARGLPRDLPNLILSDEVWRRDFGGDREIAGRVVRVGLRTARIAGVAGSWRLPGKVDAWLLESDFDSGADGAGHAIAHLTPSGDFKTGPRWAISLFAILLALLSLPALTSIRKGEYAAGYQAPSRKSRLSRWAFLLAKIAMLIPIVYFTSIDIAYSCVSLFSPVSGYLHFACSFAICLSGIDWIFRDQRQRCPICLRRVTHPAKVGQPSMIFELICASGHTLLYLPDLPSALFSAQRWLYLDASWRFMLAAPATGMNER